MKKLVALAIIILTLVIACGKAPAPIYDSADNEYKFFKILADSMGFEILNPDKVNPLAKTSKFTLYTNDVMPPLYARFSRYNADLSKMDVDGFKKAIKDLTQNLAEKKMLLVAAKENNISVADSTFEMEVEKIYERMGGKDAFLKRVATQGVTEDQIRTDIKENLIIQNFLEDVVFANNQVTDADLQELYNQDKTASVRHILFLTQGKTDDEKEEIRKKAEEVMKRAKDGEDFVTLAKTYTEDPGSKNNGGLYEDFPRGRMVPEFEEAAFNLPIGSISDLVETTYGYHILKIVERKKETKPFEEVKANLERQAEQKKKQDAVTSQIETMKKKYNYESIDWTI